MSSERNSTAERGVAAGAGALGQDSLARLLDASSEALAHVDHEWRFTCVSARAAKLSNMSAADMLGETMWELFPALVGGEMERACRHAVESGVSQRLEYFYPPMRCWLEHRLEPNADGLLIFTQDITERRLAEQRLATSVQGDSLGALDRAWRISHIDERTAALIGKAPAELVGRVLWDLFPMIRGTTLEAAMRRAMDERVPAQLEFPGPLSGRWLEILINPAADGIVIHARDIDARKRAEQALLDQEVLFRQVMENAGAVFCVAAPDLSRIEYISPRYEAIFGRSAARLYEDPGAWLEAVHPDDLAIVEEIAAAARARRDLDTSFRVVHPDGAVRWVHEHLFMVRDASGRNVRVAAIAEDITERRLAEAALQESQERLHLALDAGRMGTWECDVEGDVVRWDQMRPVLGGDVPNAGRLAAAVLRGFVHSDDAAELSVAIERALRTGDLEAEFRVRRPDGTDRWLAARGGAVRGPAGEPVRLIGVISDVTELHLTVQALRDSEEALRDGEEALREADRRKNEFLATLAHELRNPLGPMLHALHVSRRTRGEQALQAQEILERQLGHMVRLIDDLLDLSRITRNRLELRRERVELAEVVRSAIETNLPLIESLGHTLTVSLPPEPVYLDADATRLAQVFANLLTNAAKYTDRGGKIGLVAELHGDEVVVSVRDNGIGIPAEHLPRLFEMFSQLTPALDRSRGGLGIGLALVRGLVAMHGGVVEAHSEGAGKGSEFVVRLPTMAPAPAPARPAPVEAPAEGQAMARVLVVDDLRDAAETLGMILEIFGHEVRLAHDGEEALAAATSFRPDVVLLDIGLPKLNGYEVARRLREEPWGAAVILIALTGWGQEEDKERARAAGFDHHLTKPVDPDALAALLASLARPRRP